MDNSTGFVADQPDPHSEPFHVIGSSGFSREKACKYYELKNHLGNVLVTVSDLKLGQDTVGFTDTANYYFASVLSAQDYYPFGWLQPNRKWNNPDDRYGFNGMEKDDEWSGSGNFIDFGARVLDSRIGRWLSVDPLENAFPFASPFNFVSGSPILLFDPNGLYADWYRDFDGTIQFDPLVKGQQNLKQGQRYLGERFVRNSLRGGRSFFNDDGSIFFTNETDAINRIWNNSNIHHRENFVVFLPKGVLVLPDYKNNYNQSFIEEYGYNLKTKGKNTFILTGRNISQYIQGGSEVLGTIHTHQEPPKTGFSPEDLHTFTSRTPNRPFFILEDDGEDYGTRKTFLGAYGNDGVKIFDLGGLNRENVLNGDYGEVFANKNLIDYLKFFKEHVDETK